MEPAAPNYHPPKTSAHPCCPPLLSLEPSFPVGRPCRYPGQLGPQAAGWKVISLLQSGSLLCAWRELASGLCPACWGWQMSCWLFRPIQGRRPRAFPWWVGGLEQRTPAFYCSHPAWCQLLERAGRVCFCVNSALVSRGLSKINLEISLPLALVECRWLFPSLLGALSLLAEYCLWPLSVLLLCLSTVASLLNPRLVALFLTSSLPPHQSWNQALGASASVPPPLFHCLSLPLKGRQINRTCLENMKPALQP